MRTTYFPAITLFLLGFSAKTFASQPPVTIGHARFTVLTPQVIRLEYSAKGKFVDAPSLFAIHRDVELSPEENAAISIRATASDLAIDTGRIVLSYHDDGKPFSSDNLRALIRWDTTQPGLANTARWQFGKPSQGNLGGTLNRLDYVSGPVPLQEGLLSRDGWYYLEDSQRLLISPDFEKGWVQARDADSDQIDGFLFGYGLDYRSALKDMTRVSGDVPLPRKYAMGAWYSRWWAYSSDDYRRIIQEFHDHRFPIDMLVMDMDWHHEDGWTGVSWNRKLLPDAETFLAQLHEQKIHVTLNDHPQEGIKPTEDAYADFMRALGEDPASEKTLTYDAGNRTYIETLLNLTHTPLEREGVDFWWLDWMGDDQARYNKLPWMNELYFRHAEQSISEKDLRGMSFSRWADWGDHRHPIHFSGDSVIKWSTLQFEVPFTATANNVGVFYWSHDIGGFTDTNPFQPIGELLARWTQFGATSAALRLHSTKKWWLDKRPWTHLPDVEESMRRSFVLRAELFPYIYSAAWQSHVSSVGFNRPMYIDYPDSPDAYQNPQQYLWGDAFIVAPITTSGGWFSNTSSQRVWLPPGRWFDWFTGEELAGDETGRVTKDLNSFPLFARGGMPIAMQPDTERMAATPLSKLIVRVYPGIPGKTSHTQLYQDDGETRGYLRGESEITDLSYAQDGHQGFMRIGAAWGHFAGQFAERSYEIQFASFGPHVQAWVYDTSMPVSFDARTGISRVEIPEKNLNDELIVRIQFE